MRHETVTHDCDNCGLDATPPYVISVRRPYKNPVNIDLCQACFLLVKTAVQDALTDPEE